jgi:hypothetical protein
VAARLATRAAHAQGAAEPLWTGNDHVFALLCSQAGEHLLLLANFTPERRGIGLAIVHERGLEVNADAAQPEGRSAVVEGMSSTSSPTSTSACVANATQHSRGLRSRARCRCRG